jgi:carbonic anhydrase
MDPIGRRRFLAATFAAVSSSVSLADAQFTASGDALSKEARDNITPARVIDELKRGNERFRNGAGEAYDYRRQQRMTADGQYPAAIVLGCIDSRAPAEIIFDCGIGDLFNARIAGNVVNTDLLGSLEYACGPAGAKAIVVFGHTACGAIKAAIDNVKAGHLTTLLAHITPAVTETAFVGKRSSSNQAFVDAVARTNVRRSVEAIRRGSVQLADLEKKGAIQIAGAMYDVATGAVEFIDVSGIRLQQHIVPRHRHA